MQASKYMGIKQKTSELVEIKNKYSLSSSKHNILYIAQLKRKCCTLYQEVNSTSTKKRSTTLQSSCFTKGTKEVINHITYNEDWGIIYR